MKDVLQSCRIMTQLGCSFLEAPNVLFVLLPGKSLKLVWGILKIFVLMHSTDLGDSLSRVLVVILTFYRMENAFFSMLYWVNLTGGLMF